MTVNAGGYEGLGLANAIRIGWLNASNRPAANGHSLHLALGCRAGGADQCPKLGGERTQRGHAGTARSDPNRSSAPLTGCKMPKIPAD